MSKAKHKIDLGHYGYQCPTCLSEVNIQEQDCQECGEIFYSTRLSSKDLLEKHVRASGLNYSEFARKTGLTPDALYRIRVLGKDMTIRVARKLVDAGEGPDVHYWIGKEIIYE